MGGMPVTRFVLPVLDNYRGREVSLRQLSDDLKKRGTPLEDGQIQSVMLRLVSVYKYNIDIVMRGQAWVFRGKAADEQNSVDSPQKPTSGELFEKVGESATGSIIVRDYETHKLYKLTDL